MSYTRERIAELEARRLRVSDGCRAARRTRVANEVQMFRAILDEINHSFVNVESGLRIAADLEEKGVRVGYDELGHVREFAEAMRGRLLMLVQICEQEASDAA